MSKSADLQRSLLIKGFTLIELLVVVAIAAIVTGGAIAGYVRFAKVQEVVTTAQEVRDLFMTAKIKAQVREVPDTPDPCELTGYRVFFQKKANRCKTYPCIRPLCGENTNGGIIEDYPSVDIPDGLSVKIGDNTHFNVVYPTLNGEVRYGDNSEITGGSVQVNVQNSDGSIKYGFTITDGGAISNVEKR